MRTCVPIIRKETQSFLKGNAGRSETSGKEFWKLGQQLDFRQFLMRKYSPEECHITTIENYEKRIPIARANFARAGMKTERSRCLKGDALEMMKDMLEGCDYDFIFMDAAKDSIFIIFRTGNASACAREGS